MPRQLPVFYKGKLGRYFRRLRENHGWTLSRAVFIAKQRKLPVGLSALKWLEGGLAKNPRPELLRALSVLYAEPYGNMIQEVGRHVFAITPDELAGVASPTTALEEFVALPLLARSLASGQPLEITVDPHRDSRLAFRHTLSKCRLSIGGLPEEWMVNVRGGWNQPPASSACRLLESTPILDRYLEKSGRHSGPTTRERER